MRDDLATRKLTEKESAEPGSHFESTMQQPPSVVKRLVVRGRTMRIWLRVVSSDQAESSAWRSIRTSLPEALQAVEEAIAEMHEDGELDDTNERYLVLAAPEDSIFYLFRISGIEQP